VTVYKLFAADTVDEDIYDMGERKSKLSKAVLQDDRQRQAQPQQQPGKCGNNVFIVPVLADVGQCVISTPEVRATFYSVFCDCCCCTGSASKRGGKPGKGSHAVGEAAADDDAGGVGEESSAAAISSILQKALLRRVHALAAEGK
jgi:hypothetical protein